MLGIPFTSVWGTKMRLTLGIAALAATFVAASPAAAQTASADGVARGVVVQPLTLTWISDLDFGTVVSTAAPGTVRIAATAAGTRTVLGGVNAVASYPGGAAQFQGAGTTNQDVDLTLSWPTLLASGANTITVNDMYLDGGTDTQTVTIGATGVFNVYVGGEFALAANQPAGLYEGDFQLTAEYQ